ncbi:ABC transporter permease [Streptomyces sp. 21So2-11]|uniref:ABC transporter permease n=1 Tax=Streptomyces sp. 21So2-11 TaxID=3144408 RepID=UPI00321BDD1D
MSANDLTTNSPTANGPTAQTPPLTSRLYWALSDTGVMIGRSVKHATRNGEQIVVATMLPLVQLLVFRYLFGGAIDTGPVGYASYVIAGLIIISVAFNASNTAVGMANDLSEGIVERFRSMPMLSTSVLTGHVVASVVRHFISITVVVLVGLLIGFEPQGSFVQWLGALGLLTVFAAAVSWLSMIFALVAKTVEGASGLSLIIVFVPYASSAFVPPETMPGVLQGFVNNQPFTPLIDSVRGLLLDMPIGNSGWIALAWWAGILLTAIPVASLLFRRRSVR